VNGKELTPKEMVNLLDKYIIGQSDAKRAVAVALRNRYRRKRLSQELQDEVAPKNIIMIGPTGVGKTEVARRLSKITRAPFVKVEATKFTEVGYVGRDVESMIRDLMTVAVNMVTDELRGRVQKDAEIRTEEVLIDLLVPSQNTSFPQQNKDASEIVVPIDAREFIRKQLREDKLDKKQIEIEVRGKSPSIEVFSGTNIEEIDFKFGGLGNIFGGTSKKKKTTVKQARDILFQQEVEKLIDQDQVSELAREKVENNGIVFIDEIDKIAYRDGGGHGPDVSRGGVQRDILPIVEGSQVNTKYGTVDTSHILFIAAGAFTHTKPSDLMPELQGRFPIRVELNALTKEDFKRILITPQNALITQYKALLSVEGVTIDFTEESIDYLSEIAVQVNTKTENIGARRLHSILEYLLEELSFEADALSGQTIQITKNYVSERLDSIAEDTDLSCYIL